MVPMLELGKLLRPSVGVVPVVGAFLARTGDACALTSTRCRSSKAFAPANLLGT